MRISPEHEAVLKATLRSHLGNVPLAVIARLYRELVAAFEAELTRVVEADRERFQTQCLDVARKIIDEHRGKVREVARWQSHS